MRHDFPDYSASLLNRPHPSAKFLTPAKQRKFEASEVMTLERLARLVAPFEIVDAVSEIGAKHHVPTYEERGDWKVTAGVRMCIRERDSYAFCLVDGGSASWQPSEGINIIVTHVDSPILRIRAQPTWIEDSLDNRYSHPGPYLEIRPHGGLNAPDWLSATGVVSGRFSLKGGVEHRVRVAARVPHTSIHLEMDDEEKSFNRVRVFTGAESVKRLYEQFGITGEDDFGPAELYFFPNVPFQRLDNYLSSYGLDDRACVNSAIHALFQSKPHRPSFVFGLDCEEVGSTGLAARVNGFFKGMVMRSMGQRMTLQYAPSFEYLYAQGVLGTVPGICGDVGPVPTYNETEMMHLHIALESARFGFGPFVTSSWGLEGNSVSPTHVRFLQDILDQVIGKQSGTRCWQVVGSEFKSEEGTFYDIAHFGKYFTEEHVPMVALGVPVSDLHRPGGEMLYLPDLYLTTKAYKGYLDSPRRND